MALSVPQPDHLNILTSVSLIIIEAMYLSGQAKDPGVTRHHTLRSPDFPPDHLTT